MQNILDELKQRKLTPDRSLWQAMVAAKAERPDVATFTLAKASRTVLDIAAFNSILEVVCKTGDMSLALTVLREAESRQLVPDLTTLNTLLSGCLRRQTSPLAEYLYNKIVSANKDIVPTAETFEGLAKAALQSGSPRLASQIVLKSFEKKAGPRSDVFEQVISQCVQARLLNDVQLLLNERSSSQEQEGALALSKTTCQMIAQLAESHANVTLAERACTLVAQDGSATATAVQESLLRTYARARRYEDSFNALKGLHAKGMLPSAETKQVLADSLARSPEDVERCLVMARDLVGSKLVGVELMNVIVSAFAQLHLPDRSYSTFLEIPKLGLSFTSESFVAVFSCLKGEGHNITRAEALLSEMSMMGLVNTETVAAASAAFVRCNRPARAFEILQSSASAGIPVDSAWPMVIRKVARTDAGEARAMLSSVPDLTVRGQLESYIAEQNKQREIKAAEEKAKKAQTKKKPSPTTETEQPDGTPRTQSAKPARQRKTNQPQEAAQQQQSPDQQQPTEEAAPQPTNSA